MVLLEQPFQEVQCLGRAQVLHIWRHESFPRLFGLADVGSQQAVLLVTERDPVLLQVLVEVLSANHLRNLDELVGVGGPMEERFFAEQDGSQHAP